MPNSAKEKNIQIPQSLFNSIVELIDSLDTVDFDPILMLTYNAVQHGLRTKRISMLHRETYAAVVCAKDVIKKRTALDNYVNTKNFYKNS